MLQLEASANPKDPAIAALVGKLSTRSAEFRTWWSAPNPQTRTAGTKRFAHPVACELRINWEAFTVPDQPRHILFVSSAADQESDTHSRSSPPGERPNNPPPCKPSTDWRPHLMRGVFLPGNSTTEIRELP